MGRFFIFERDGLHQGSRTGLQPMGGRRGHWVALRQRTSLFQKGPVARIGRKRVQRRQWTTECERW